MGNCPMCGGTGRADAVWYGRKTGKKTRCQLCGGTGNSSAVDIFKL